MLKKLEIMFYVIVAMMVLYGIVCYVDIIAHNLNGGSDAQWNFFVQMVKRN